MLVGSIVGVSIIVVFVLNDPAVALMSRLPELLLRVFRVGQSPSAHRHR